MHVERVPNRNSRPAVLLRETWREDGKVKKRTIANLSDWADEKIELLRLVLRGETLVKPGEVFSTERSLPHGHVEAILGTIRKIGLESMLGSTRCRERDLVVAMIVERLIAPASKLATTRLWKTTTLAEDLAVDGADVDELYDAMDWLLGRQERIEKKLAKKHLSADSLVLYDVSSSYYEGRTCPLAKFGHNRDGKKGLPIIVYGVLANNEGCPVSVDVYSGNTSDPNTVPDQVEKLRERFDLPHVVLVGDRGMLTQPQIEKLRQCPGLGWISALRSTSIRELLDQGLLQMSLFDEKNLAAIESPDFPGERLIACFNPLLAEERRRKRGELLDATEKDLARISREVARRTGTPLTAAEIGMKVGRVAHRRKMKKHFEITITDGTLSFSRRQSEIEHEEQLDGIYVIRTSQSRESIPDDDVVRSYKSLANVERVFRSLKGIDNQVRPIRHRTEDHVRAHIFLCLLAYYVEWHMRRALAPFLFQDEELTEARKTRDPVLPAQSSAAAKKKKSARQFEDHHPIHSFDTLLADLATRCRNTCRVASDTAGTTFQTITKPTPFQQKAMELLGL